MKTWETTLFSIFVICLAACSTVSPAELEDRAATIDTLTTHTAETQKAPTMTAAPTLTLIPTATETPLACMAEGGQMVQETLRSELMNLPFEFDVYLPPCYDEQADRYYPTLYLIHGQSFRQDQWQRLGATTITDALIADGELSPFIIVMPRDPNWRQPIETEFDEVFLQDLIPYIDTTYRTLTDRQHRAVGGLSRGAGWALTFGFSEWQLFGAIGMHSLAVLWGNSYLIPTWLDAIPPDYMPRIYMDIGDHDRLEIKQSAEEFEAVLTERGIPHEFHVYEGYHDEKYWGAHVEEYIRFYAAGW